MRSFLRTGFWANTSKLKPCDARRHDRKRCYSSYRDPLTMSWNATSHLARCIEQVRTRRIMVLICQIRLHAGYCANSVCHC